MSGRSRWRATRAIGVVDPIGGLNHRFVVVGVQGDSVTSIDGNAGWYMEIVNKWQGYF